MIFSFLLCVLLHSFKSVYVNLPTLSHGGHPLTRSKSNNIHNSRHFLPKSFMLLSCEVRLFSQRKRERESEREREREREAGRQTGRQASRKASRQADRQKERKRERGETLTYIYRERDRQTDRQTETDRLTDRDRE